MDDLDKDRIETQRVALGRIRPFAGQPRRHFSPEALAGLAESIKAVGVLEPLLLRPLRRPVAGADRVGKRLRAHGVVEATGTFEIVAGERRWRAAELAGLKDVPARVLDLTDQEAADVRLIENDQREDLRPSERARAYQAEVDKGRSAEDLAKAIGRSAFYVRGVLRLGRLTDGFLAAVDSGFVPRATAELVARVPGEKARRKVELCVLQAEDWDPDRVKPTGKAAESPLDFRTTRQLIHDKFTVGLRNAPFSLEDPLLLVAAGTCQACPKRTGNAKAQDTDLADFPDDVCLDPECFRAKTAALERRDRGAGGGTAVLPKAQSKDLFDRWGTLKGDTPYLDLAKTCPDDPKARTYREVIGAAVRDQVQVAYDAAGGRHELVTKAAATKALEAAGLKKPAARSVDPRYQSTPAQRKAVDERKAQEARVRQLLLAEVGASVRALFATFLPAGDATVNGLLRPVAAHIHEHGFGPDYAALVQRLGWPEGGAGRDGLARMDAAALVAFLVEATSADGHRGADPKALADVAKLLQIDRKALERRARQEPDGPAAANGHGKASRARPPEALADVGLTEEELKASYVASKWVGRAPREPVGVKPVWIEGVAYVNSGAVPGPDRDEWRLERLYPAPVFPAVFPAERPRLTPRPLDALKATDAERDSYYFGTRVREGKKEYVIGPPAERRTLYRDKAPAKPAAPKKAKAGAGR